MADISHKKRTPSRFLIENIGLLPPKGRVLDIAMGRGRNSIYLAEIGFQVEGVDISPQAVESAMESARESGVEIDGLVADLEGDYRIAKDAYDVIVCFNYLQRSLIPDIKNGTREGGVVVYETFNIDQTQFGKPRNPDHLLKHNELPDIFRDFRCLRYHEGITDGRKSVAGIVAVKSERAKT
jgi:2-polyprenyl-3-methyl-5-hydroxy-6-metoxy-1,4-benzoquinol methylase